jgi:hypothetical protein
MCTLQTGHFYIKTASEATLSNVFIVFIEKNIFWYNSSKIPTKNGGIITFGGPTVVSYNACAGKIPY